MNGHTMENWIQNEMMDDHEIENRVQNELRMGTKVGMTEFGAEIQSKTR